jgi:uncharacterized membrane protein
MNWLAVLIVFAVSPLPIVEMRLGIGLGLFRYHLNPWLTFAIAVAANLAIIPQVWYLFPPVERLLRRSRRLSRWLDWLFAKTRRETTKGKQKMEEAALFAIVALTAVPFPLPGSGLYTALVAAYIFGLPMRKSFPWLAAGVVFACGALVFLGVAYRHLFR